eukprot:scaffold62550_cov60-Phaeocystis_antarctica.AAC.3
MASTLLTYFAYLACARHQADELHLEGSKGGGGNEAMVRVRKAGMGVGIRPVREVFLLMAFSVTRSATQARRRVEGGVQAETCANGLWQDRGERAVVHCACAYACVSTAWRTARVHLDG